MEKEEEAYDFLAPVDFKALGLDDYPHIIKNPIDLGTIGKKLKQGQYPTMQDVINDFMLIWDNCRTYNMMDSPIVAQAEAMELHMKNHCARLKIVGEFTRRVVGRKSRDEIIMEEAGPVQDISTEQMAELSHKASNVPNRVISEIVTIIDECCKIAIEELEAEKVEIKLDKLDRTTFDRISKLLSDNQIVS